MNAKECSHWSSRFFFPYITTIMEVVKVGIVGGGMSGLYTAYKLLKKGYNVTVFEKSNRLGGRIHSINLHKSGVVETGAGRFNKRHVLLLKLIRECKLKSNVSPIGKTKRVYEQYGRLSNLTFQKYVAGFLFGNIKKWLKKYSIAELKSLTTKKLLLNEFRAPKIVDHIINAFGYNSEFEIQNAYTTLTILSKEFNDDIPYYYLQGGRSQLIQCLEKKIIDNGGTIVKNSNVLYYEPASNTLQVERNQQFTVNHFDKVVFACTKSRLLKFKSLMQFDHQLLNYLNSIEMAPLNRIFVKFPMNENGHVWFQDLLRTTTPLPIRYIIPLNYETGLIQISYTDNEFASYWHTLTRQECEKQIIHYLRKMFPDRHIPNPVWLERFYWREGVTYWKPSYKVYRNSKNKNYYIAGEIMSTTHSGWIEGALESSKRVVDLFTTR